MTEIKKYKQIYEHRYFKFYVEQPDEVQFFKTDHRMIALYGSERIVFELNDFEAPSYDEWFTKRYNLIKKNQTKLYKNIQREYDDLNLSFGHLTLKEVQGKIFSDYTTIQKRSPNINLE